MFFLVFNVRKKFFVLDNVAADTRPATFYEGPAELLKHQRKKLFDLRGIQSPEVCTKQQNPFGIQRIPQNQLILMN